MRLPGLLAVVGVLSSQLAPLASHSHGVEGALEHLQRLAEKLDRDVAKAAHHLHGEAAVLSTDSDGKTRASGLFSLRLGDKADGAVLEAVGPSVVQSEASVELTVRLDHCGPQRLWTQMYLLEDVGTGDGAPRGPLFREEYPAKSLKHLLQVKGAGGGMRGTFGPNPVDKLMFLQHEVPDLSPLSVPNSVDIVQELQRTRDAHGLTVPGDGSASGMHSRRVLTSASPHAKTLRRAMLAEYDTALKEAAASSDRTGWDPAPGTQGVAKPTLLERAVAAATAEDQALYHRFGAQTPRLKAHSEKAQTPAHSASDTYLAEAAAMASAHADLTNAARHSSWTAEPGRLGVFEMDEYPGRGVFVDDDHSIIAWSRDATGMWQGMRLGKCHAQKWMTVTFVQDGALIAGFIDGRRVSSLRMMGTVGSRYVGRFSTGDSLAAPVSNAGSAGAPARLQSLCGAVATFRVWSSARSQVDVSCGCRMGANFTGTRSLCIDAHIGLESPKSLGALQPSLFGFSKAPASLPKTPFLKNAALLGTGSPSLNGKTRTQQPIYQLQISRPKSAGSINAVAHRVFSLGKDTLAEALGGEVLVVEPIDDAPLEAKRKKLPGWQHLTPTELRAVRQCFPQFRLPGAESVLRPKWKYRGQALPAANAIVFLDDAGGCGYAAPPPNGCGTAEGMGECDRRGPLGLSLSTGACFCTGGHSGRDCSVEDAGAGYALRFGPKHAKGLLIPPLGAVRSFTVRMWLAVQKFPASAKSAVEFFSSFGLPSGNEASTKAAGATNHAGDVSAFFDGRQYLNFKVLGNEPEVVVFDEYKFGAVSPNVPASTPGDPVHLAVVYSALRPTKPGTGSVSLFVNGVLKQTIGYRHTAPFAGFYNGLAVGAQNVRSRKPLDGVIDELAIYDRALTPRELFVSTGLPTNARSPNLLAYYSFDEGHGVSILDRREPPETARSAFQSRAAPSAGTFAASALTPESPLFDGRSLGSIARVAVRNDALLMSAAGTVDLTTALQSDFFVISAADVASCPEDLQECSKMGQCRGGNCTCPSGREGLMCEISSCQGTNISARFAACSGHGRCVNTWHKGGESLPSKLPNRTANDFSNSTAANLTTDETCSCDPGFSGPMCSDYSPDSCAHIDCGQHGSCVQGLCICNKGWHGVVCEKQPCAGALSDNVFCSGHGHCVGGGCLCFAGWGGRDCGRRVHCAAGCSGHGVCLPGGVCDCVPGFTGATCSWGPGCPNFCSGNGLCVNNSCQCGTTTDNANEDAMAKLPVRSYSGEACAELQCNPSDCSGHGVCDAGRCVCQYVTTYMPLPRC
eukprot:INCI7191.2.p1 GENE.INCI7191.2~~INCI7191.2.p1  ORF type:complete len:1369 (-),score=189.98 INCI7191.2:1873-5790(-)